MRNDKGQFIKGHPIFATNPFTKGNKIGPRFEKGYTPWNKDKKTGPLSKEWRTNIGRSLKGKLFSEERKNKLRKPKLEGASQYWFGSKSEYKALHHWIGKKFGKPTRCEECGQDGLTRHKIHWASKNKQYTRDRKDWIRLCAKCHAIKDKLKK